MTRNNSQHLILLGRYKNISRELGKPPDSAVYIKEKLKEHFDEKILIIIVNNWNVVTFRRTIGTIINEFYKQPKVDDYEVEQNSMVAGLNLRAQLYGLGHPRQPFPWGNFIEHLYVKTWFV